METPEAIDPASELEKAPDWRELADCIDCDDSERAAALLDSLSSADTAHGISRLSEDQRSQLVRLVGAEAAAELVEELPGALASGPILTTVTDMCGFFLVLSFASAMLERL